MLKTKKVLVVDDTAITAYTTLNILSHYGIKYDYARDGAEGFSFFSKSCAGEYTAVITDIIMPVADGFALAKAIRSSSHPGGKTIPIIALTSCDGTEDIQHCFRCGMNAYIHKPISCERLMDVLDRL